MKAKSLAQWLPAVLLVAAAIFLALGPFFLKGYWIRVLTSMFMFAVVAEGINLIAGYTGYPAFGNVVFFGVGAYTVAILMTRAGLPFAVSLVAAGVVAALFAVVLGFPILRLSGHYFAIATIGVNIATREIVTNLDVTGGGHGIALPVAQGSPAVLYGFFYYLMFLLMVATVAATWWISRNPFGFALRAIRDEKDAAEVMGIDTTVYKVAAWAVSALFTGLAGGIYAYWMSFLEPAYAFDVTISVKGFAMMLMGGLGTVTGPVLGAFFLELLSEVVWGSFLNLHLLILGLFIILVVIFMPRGLLNWLNGWRLLRKSLGLEQRG